MDSRHLTWMELSCVEEGKLLGVRYAGKHSGCRCVSVTSSPEKSPVAAKVSVRHTADVCSTVCGAVTKRFEEFCGGIESQQMVL